MSKTPTAYLLIKARTNSEWDNCDFIIVEVSSSWQNLLLDRLGMLEIFKDNKDSYGHLFWDAPLGFFIHRPDEDDDLRIFLDSEDGEAWCFLEPEEYCEEFTVPENKLGTFQMMLTATGELSYRAYGEHSGEEFWSEEIDVLMIINILNER